jgi:hypothetical protein
MHEAVAQLTTKLSNDGLDFAFRCAVAKRSAAR